MKRFLVRRICRNRRLRINVVVVVCVVAVIVATLVRCCPVVTAFAESQAIWDVSKIANRTALQVLSEQADVCNRTIRVEYDGAQKVSSVYMDVAGINTVRSVMTEMVMAAIEETASIAVAIPLSTVLGWRWLSGMGPLITFPVSFTATVLSDVSSSLDEIGINQSAYRVMIHLDISLYLVSPMGRSTVSTRVTYPMAEAVLLGEVPDNLTEVYGDDQSLLGQIFDYGTLE